MRCVHSEPFFIGSSRADNAPEIEERPHSTPPCFGTVQRLDLPSPHVAPWLHLPRPLLKLGILASLRKLYTDFIPGCKVSIHREDDAGVCGALWFDREGRLACHMNRVLGGSYFDYAEDDDVSGKGISTLNMDIGLAYVHPDYRGYGLCSALIGQEAALLKRWCPDPRIRITMGIEAAGVYGETRGIAYWVSFGADFEDRDARRHFLRPCSSWCDHVVGLALGPDAAKKSKAALNGIRYPWDVFTQAAVFEHQAPTMQSLKQFLVSSAANRGWSAVLHIRPETCTSPFSTRVKRAETSMQQKFAHVEHEPFVLRDVLCRVLDDETDIAHLFAAIAGLKNRDASEYMNREIVQILAHRSDVIELTRRMVESLDDGVPPRWTVLAMLARVIQLAEERGDLDLNFWAFDQLAHIAISSGEICVARTRVGASEMCRTSVIGHLESMMRRCETQHDWLAVIYASVAMLPLRDETSPAADWFAFASMVASCPLSLEERAMMDPLLGDIDEKWAACVATLASAPPDDAEPKMIRAWFYSATNFVAWFSKPNGALVDEAMPQFFRDQVRLIIKRPWFVHDYDPKNKLIRHVLRDLGNQ